MTERTAESIAPDMGRLLIELPGEEIVLLSWIVSEYDGLGFVTSERVLAPKERGEGSRWLVSLYYPGERRQDVLELLTNLGKEGIGLSVLGEEPPRPQRSGSNREETHDYEH